MSWKRACSQMALTAFVVSAVLMSGVGLAQEPTLRAVYNALSGAMSPIWIGQEAGLFSKHGVSVELKYLAATTAVQGMLAGSDDVGLVGNQGIDAKLEGAEMVYVATGIPTFVFQLYGQPGINSVSDLKGKVVAVTQPAASTDYAARIVLQRNGLIPDKDVKILYAGNITALLSAMKSGNAQGGILSAPTSIQARAAGLKVIVNVTELKIPFLFTGILTLPRVVREKNEELTRFLRGYIEAIAVLRRSKDISTRALGKYLKTTDREVLDAVYEDYKNVFPQVPLMSVAEVKAVLDVVKNPKARQMSPEDFFDNSIVEKIRTSGFIDSLYGKK